MRSQDAATAAALQSGRVVPRDFLWIVPRDRGTGNPMPRGLWSDLGSVSAQVIDPATGDIEARSFTGAGDLVQMSPIALAAGWAVQSVDITFSQVTPEAAQIVRGYDARLAPVQIFRGFLDPVSGLLVAPARCYFVGQVDEAPIETPPEGEEGSITITALSHAQELSRTNPARRSDADQRLRSATDGFFRHAAAAGSWVVHWGQASE